MGRLSAGLRPHLRARSSHSSISFVRRTAERCLSILLFCVVAVGIVLLLSNRLSAPSRDFHSADISAFLLELGEQIKDAGDNVPQMQLRLLRLAAGLEPEHPDRASRVFSELLASIKSLGKVLPCPAMDTMQGPTNATGCSKGCFFAANLYNSMDVLPNMIVQVLAVLGSLGGGEDAQRSFVSVYESGSTDATPLLLHILRQLLDLLGVPNRVMTNGDINRGSHLQQQGQQQQGQRGRRWLRWSRGPKTLAGDDRIRYLADLRNAALEPLLEPMGHSDGSRSDPSQPQRADRIIFINDVFFCPTDVRRLLRYDSADVACGMDFVPAALWLLNQNARQQLMIDHIVGDFGVPRRMAKALSQSWLLYSIWKKLYGKSRAIQPWSFPVFYDMWVARDVSGGRIRNRVPYSLDSWTADRLAHGYPTPVYCCWNGLVNLRAEPFLKQTKGESRGSVEVLGGANAVSSGGDGDLKEENSTAVATDSKVPLRFRSHNPDECAASECSLMCDDLHAAGYHRVLLEPNVRVAYDWTIALKLYNNFDLVAPENAPGLRFKPMALGDPRQVEVSWTDDWLPRMKFGMKNVECCGIQPGKQTADFERGCTPRDMTGIWGRAPVNVVQGLELVASEHGFGEGGIGP